MYFTWRFFVLFLLASSAFNLNAGIYHQEFHEFKNRSFCMRDDVFVDSSLQAVQRDVAICQHANWLQRLACFPMGLLGGVMIAEQDMPKLHVFIDEICKQGGIEKPTVSVMPCKGFLGAVASKLFVSTGAIIIGQELFEQSDEELEAIVTREIGRMVYSHNNKGFGLGFCLATLATVVMQQHKAELSLMDRCYAVLFASILSSLLIGKKFEKQVDQFACEQGKAAGMVSFFKMLIDKEQQKADDLNQTYNLLREHRSTLSFFDYYVNLMPAYYWARVKHSLGSAYKLLYNERAEAAEQYLAAIEA